MGDDGEFAIVTRHEILDRGRVHRKYVAGTPESLEIARERYTAHPRDPWFHQCVVEALVGVEMRDWQKLRGMTNTDPSRLAAQAQAIDQSIHNLEQARQLLLKTHESDAPRQQAIDPDRNTAEIPLPDQRNLAELDSSYRINHQRILKLIGNLNDSRIEIGYLLRIGDPENELWQTTSAISSYVEWLKKRGDFLFSRQAAVELFQKAAQRAEQGGADSRSDWFQIMQHRVTLENDILRRDSPRDLRRYIAIYDRLLEKLESGDFYLVRARLYRDLQQFDQAREDLNRYLKHYGHRDTYEHEIIDLERFEAIIERRKQRSEREDR